MDFLTWEMKNGKCRFEIAKARRIRDSFKLSWAARPNDPVSDLLSWDGLVPLYRGAVCLLDARISRNIYNPAASDQRAKDPPCSRDSWVLILRASPLCVRPSAKFALRVEMCFPLGCLEPGPFPAMWGWAFPGQRDGHIMEWKKRGWERQKDSGCVSEREEGWMGAGLKKKYRSFWQVLVRGFNIAAKLRLQGHRKRDRPCV